MLEDDVDGDPFGREPVEALTEPVGRDLVLFHESTETFVVPVALDRQNHAGEVVDRPLHLLEVHPIGLGALVVGERSGLGEKAELHQIRAAVRARPAEADRAEDRREKRDVVIVEALVLELPSLDELGDHEQTEHVGFRFFESRGALLERVPDASAAVDGVLDAESVGDFVEHDVGEERVEVDELALIFGDNELADGNEDLVELRPHGILELKPARAFLELHFLVVRQVDRDRLRARIGVAGVVDHVIGVQV